MPTIETIAQGLPNEVQVLIKVPHWHLDQGRVYWHAKMPKDLFIPLVNLVEDGQVDKEKEKLQLEFREMKAQYKELEKEKEKVEKSLADLKKEMDNINKAKEKFLKAVNS